MKRFLLLLIAILLSTNAFADSTDSKKVQNVESSARATTISVPDTDTVYSKSFPVKSVSSNLAFMYKITPATGDSALYLEQSYDQPTTEGSADPKYVVTNVIDSQVNDGDWHIATIDTVVMTNARVKAVGQGSNPSTTVLTMKAIVR